MSYHYVPRKGQELGYWTSSNPDMQDMEQMVFELKNSQFYNFVVIGQPKRISSEWISKHLGYTGDNYDYAVSYSIYEDDIGDMLDDTETPVEAFNYYLEGTGKEWVDIYELKLVDRRQPWENTM